MRVVTSIPARFSPYMIIIVGALAQQGVPGSGSLTPGFPIVPDQDPNGQMDSLPPVFLENADAQRETTWKKYSGEVCVQAKWVNHILPEVKVQLHLNPYVSVLCERRRIFRRGPVPCFESETTHFPVIAYHRSNLSVNHSPPLQFEKDQGAWKNIVEKHLGNELVDRKSLSKSTGRIQLDRSHYQAVIRAVPQTPCIGIRMSELITANSHDAKLKTR